MPEEVSPGRKNKSKLQRLTEMRLRAKQELDTRSEKSEALGLMNIAQLSNTNIGTSNAETMASGRETGRPLISERNLIAKQTTEEDWSPTKIPAIMISE